MEITCIGHNKNECTMSDGREPSHCTKDGTTGLWRSLWHGIECATHWWIYTYQQWYVVVP